MVCFWTINIIRVLMMKNRTNASLDLCYSTAKDTESIGKYCFWCRSFRHCQEILNLQLLLGQLLARDQDPFPSPFHVVLCLQFICWTVSCSIVPSLSKDYVAWGFLSLLILIRWRWRWESWYVSVPVNDSGDWQYHRRTNVGQGRPGGEGGMIKRQVFTRSTFAQRSHSSQVNSLSWLLLHRLIYGLDLFPFNI